MSEATQPTTTSYVAPPTVGMFMRGMGRFRLIMGPIGSGKSVGCLMEIARRAQEQAKAPDGLRYTRWVIVRNTREQLRDSVIKTWNQWFPPGVAGSWRETNMTFTLRFGDVHAEVLFRALDEPDDVRRLLSLEITGFYSNETRELPKEIIVALLSRCGRFPSAKDGGPTWYGGIGDTNPPSTDSWLYESFENEKPSGWEIYKQPGGMDPLAENRKNLPATYYEDMCNGADKQWVDVHVHARYGRSKMGRPVYEGVWVPDFHNVSGLTVIAGVPVVVGLDAGRTPAASFFQKDARGRINLLAETTSDNMGMERFLREKVKPLLFARFPGHPVVVGADPAVWQKSQLSEKSVADVIKEAKLLLPKPSDMSNRIAPRLQAVEGLLSQQIDGGPMFRVSNEHCPLAIAGFEHGYRYKRKRDGQYEEVPDKNEFSHLADSIQYGCQIAENGAQYVEWLSQVRVVEAVSMNGWT